MSSSVIDIDNLIHHFNNAFKSLNPSNVTHLWNSLSREEKNYLCINKNSNNVSFLLLLCYYTPKNQELNKIYYDFYFYLLITTCRKIQSCQDKNRIFDSYTIKTASELFGTYEPSIKDDLLCPLILACKRMHMIYAFHMINAGANPYVFEKQLPTLFYKPMSSIEIIDGFDYFGVSFYGEMLCQKIDHLKYECEDNGFYGYKVRRINLLKLINEAKIKVQLGQGDTLYHFNYSNPYLSRSTHMSKITFNNIIFYGTKALEEVKNQYYYYHKFFDTEPIIKSRLIFSYPVKNKLSINVAATKIQAIYKGYNYRKFLREYVAASRIQAIYKGYNYRKLLKIHIAKYLWIVKIQALYRGYRTRKQIFKPGLELLKYVMRIQAYYRNYKTRNQMI